MERLGLSDPRRRRVADLSNPITIHVHAAASTVSYACGTADRNGAAFAITSVAPGTGRIFSTGTWAVTVP